MRSLRLWRSRYGQEQAQSPEITLSTNCRRVGRQCSSDFRVAMGRGLRVPRNCQLHIGGIHHCKHCAGNSARAESWGCARRTQASMRSYPYSKTISAFDYLSLTFFFFRGSICASTEAASFCTSRVVSVLGAANPFPAMRLIVGDVIGSTFLACANFFAI